MKQDEMYDLIVIGAGAAGMIAAITAAKEKNNVLLLEKLPQIGAKLKATGGGRCNLSNTLSQDEFMSKFGRDGRFMQDALNAFSSKDMQELRHTHLMGLGSFQLRIHHLPYLKHSQRP